MARARIDRGVVQAVFEAFTTGGFSVLLHGGMVRGAPADDFGSHGAIRPFQPWNGLHFCAEDWHVILIATIEGGDQSFTRQDADRLLSGTKITFNLDGVELVTSRTAIKRFLDPARFGLEVAYAFQEGRLMSPGDLSPGDHTLSVVAAEPGQPVFANAITFSIDPASAGTCAD
jgi:hypothetical protein